jgi:hypothetical protein
MANTPKLNLPLPGNSAGAETRVSESLYLAESVLTGVNSRLATPPGSPADGDSHLIIATATDAWAGLEDSIAVWVSSQWIFVAPAEGMSIRINAEGQRGVSYWYDGSAWLPDGGAMFLTLHRELSGSQTSAYLLIQGAGESLTQPMPLMDSYTIVRSASQVVHDHGSDPGDWTIDIQDNAAASYGTFDVELNASSAVPQVTTQNHSIDIDAGDSLKVEATGPSTTSPEFFLHLKLVERA